MPVEVGFEPDLTGEAGGEHTEAHIDDTVMVVTDDLGEVGAGKHLATRSGSLKSAHVSSIGQATVNESLSSTGGGPRACRYRAVAVDGDRTDKVRTLPHEGTSPVVAADRERWPHRGAEANRRSQFAVVTSRREIGVDLGDLVPDLGSDTRAVTEPDHERA